MTMDTFFFGASPISRSEVGVASLPLMVIFAAAAAASGLMSMMIFTILIAGAALPGVAPAEPASGAPPGVPGAAGPRGFGGVGVAGPDGVGPAMRMSGVSEDEPLSLAPVVAAVASSSPVPRPNRRPQNTPTAR